MADEAAKWTSVPPESAREVLRQAELMMSELLASANAGDARAAMLFAGFAAITAALFAGAATLANVPKIDHGLIWALLVAGAFFLVTSLISVWAAMPTDYFAAGNEPDLLIGAAREPAWLVTSSIESLQRRIGHNRHELEVRACWTRLAYGVAWASFVAAAIAFMAAHAHA